MKCLCDKCKHADGCPAKAEHGGALRCSAFKRNEQTNEEWLKSMNTEDVAKWLSKISKFFHGCGKRDVYPKTMYEEDWEWWLKEKHE